ncbi:hypothetical protein FKM82_007504 [Ascaphus truei]
MAGTTHSPVNAPSNAATRETGSPSSNSIPSASAVPMVTPRGESNLLHTVAKAIGHIISLPTGVPSINLCPDQCPNGHLGYPPCVCVGRGILKGDNGPLAGWHP